MCRRPEKGVGIGPVSVVFGVSPGLLTTAAGQADRAVGDERASSHVRRAGGSDTLITGSPTPTPFAVSTPRGRAGPSAR